MKTLALLFSLLVAGTAFGQLSGISPTGGTQGQHIDATITSTGQFYFRQDSFLLNPDVAYVKIYLGTDTIRITTDSLTYVSYNTLTAHFNIPAAIPDGVYSLELYSYSSGVGTLLSSFTIGTGATINGTAFHDINRNGTQDAGEPGVAGYSVHVDGGQGGITDASGHYSLYALVGSHTVSANTLPDDGYGYTTATSGTVTVGAAPVTGPSFGLVPTRFLVSAAPGIDTAGKKIVLLITDSNVTQNSSLVHIGLRYGTSTYFTADTMSIIDAAHIRAVFTHIPYFRTPYGHYSLGVSVRNNSTQDIRSFTLDSAVLIVAPIGFISGYAYDDANNNGTKDAGELPLSGRAVVVGGYMVTTDSTGYYSFSGLPDSTFTVTSYDPSSFYGSCAGGAIVVSPAGGYTVTIHSDSVLHQDFGFYSSGIAAYNLFIHPGWRPANPGFDRDYWIWYGNLSNLSATNGVITFQYDPLLTYVSCDVTPSSHDLVNHILTWNVGNIDPTPQSVGTTGTAPEWYGGWVSFNLKMHVPVSATNGTLIHSVFSISPTANDCSLWDNVVDETSPITSSHDPNEKHANPYNTLVHGKDSTIEYTVDFQNTGTASSHFVIVTDTLDPNLEPLSVQVTGASHRYLMKNNNNVLTFTFDPCILTDSATDEKHSKGSIQFKVKMKPNLPVGTVIRNNADIYFDYNPAVRTNTTVNTIDAGVGIIDIATEDHVVVRPNPFHESTTIAFLNDGHEPYTLTVYDLMGHEVTTMKTSADQFDISGRPFATGVYLFRITNQNTLKTNTGKLVVE